MLLLSFSAVPLLAVQPGCGGASSEAPRALHYSEDAKRAYEKAMVAFNNHDWEEAKALFKDVKRKYGYSRYARLAELRIADADFASEKLAESIQGYRTFVHDHRTDPEVSYARFRIASALFEQVSDSPLLPPQEERDQAATADAYRELSSFVREFPTSPHQRRARYLLAVIVGRLVRHELYVARFYLKRDNFEAAAARIQYALRTFPGSDVEAEGMVMLGETYLKMHKRAEAQATFAEVMSKHPGNAFSVAAQNFLLEMQREGK